MVKYKNFGANGPNISEIGMGTYYDPFWIIASRLNWLRGKQSKVEAIRAGIEKGINLIDTAELYGSEPIVAEAIKGLNREKLFITTKILPNHLKHDAFMKSLESSLKRLNTEYVDLYLIHWRASADRIKEAMASMEMARENGLIKMIGVSNFNLQQIKDARHFLKKNDISAVQLEYNVLNRKPEADILPYCEKEGIAFMAYYPLAHGKLVKNNTIFKISQETGLSPAQLALKWLLRNPIVFPIPRASKIKHVIENAETSDLEVDEKILDKISLLS